MDLGKIKNKMARKAIKEIATQIAEMPEEPPKEDNMEEEKKKSSEDFISKRDLCFLLGGFFAGYLLFHNSIKLQRTGRF